MKESFRGDLNGKAQAAVKGLLEAESRRQRDRYWCREVYERRGRGSEYRNGFYERDFVTRFGTLRLRIARTRGRAFLPAGLRSFQRRADEVALLIREAFLREISTRQVGRVVAIVTGESVSAQTVSTVAKSLDRLVKRFHEAALRDEWAYLFLDGVSLRAQRLENDVPELLSFFHFPRYLRRKLRTTNVIERCFVEVRRRTRPMVCLVNVQSVDRIVFSIFNRYNPQWKNRTLQLFTQAA